VGPTGAVSSRVQDKAEQRTTTTAKTRRLTGHPEASSAPNLPDERTCVIRAVPPRAPCQNDNSVSDIIPVVSSPRFGARGEFYVVIQFVLLVLVIGGPVQISGWPDRLTERVLTDVLAVVLVIAGAALLVAGTRTLGRNLTPLPYPKAGGTFVDRGVYRYARHPIYGGLMLLACGWSLRRGGALALAYSLLLAVLLHVKSGREERWLAARFPAYAAYRAHTRRFIPFVW
jgi:protein-S-isoprenylcysteine O-methyltransferase Ste14